MSLIVAQVDFYTRHEERSLVKPRRVTSNDVGKLNGVTINEETVRDYHSFEHNNS